MVATAPSKVSAPAGPPVQGRSASRSASDRRGDIEVLPEIDVFARLDPHRFGSTVAAPCGGRTRPHHRDSHRVRPRFSGQTRVGCEDRARYYHPGLARFISEDPLAGSRNLYVYARNNALRYVDPRGEAEIRAFGHTFNVFASLTLGVINIQADLNQVNVNFVVAPSFGVGADFLIDVPADAVTLQVGPTRNLAIGTALVQAEEGCTLCLGRIQAQGVIISVTPFVVPVAPVPVFLTVPITTIYADPNRKPQPVIFPSLLPPASASSAGSTTLGKRK